MSNEIKQNDTEQNYIGEKTSESVFWSVTIPPLMQVVRFVGSIIIARILDPKDFFRANRQLIVQLEAIKKISTWFNSRLRLELEAARDINLVVSRERVAAFKTWLDS